MTEAAIGCYNYPTLWFLIFILSFLHFAVERGGWRLQGYDLKGLSRRLPWPRTKDKGQRKRDLQFTYLLWHSPTLGSLFLALDSCLHDCQVWLGILRGHPWSSPFLLSLPSRNTTHRQQVATSNMWFVLFLQPFKCEGLYYVKQTSFLFQESVKL